MYKLISTALVGLLALLTSCEKPILASEESTDQTTEGNLTVRVFQVEQTPFTLLSRTAANDICTRLNYAIYNEDGSRVKQINQEHDDADFGHATFQLTEGTYQLVVVAHSCKGNPTMTNPAKIQFSNTTTGYTDTFLYSEEITVNDEKTELKVPLKRIVSLCRFIVTDDFPADVKTMQFKYTGGSGAFNAYTGLGCVKSTQTVTYTVADGDKQFDLYTFLHDTEGTITLTVTALDAAENVISERQFNVPLVQNKITWFSGPFFDESGSQNTITIDINTEWDGETHLTF